MFPNVGIAASVSADFLHRYQSEEMPRVCSRPGVDIDLTWLIQGSLDALAVRRWARDLFLLSKAEIVFGLYSICRCLRICGSFLFTSGRRPRRAREARVVQGATGRRKQSQPVGPPGNVLARVPRYLATPEPYIRHPIKNRLGPAPPIGRDSSTSLHCLAGTRVHTSHTLLS